ncbi:hypothetical protein, partial [Chryseobacterium gambrini]|uniref:hypothetical protein n=2 Tax=cellular organisms TaxID=131567 RepID=UPI0025B6037C
APTTEWWADRWIGSFELPNGEPVEVHGLREYVELDETVTYTTERSVDPQGDTASWVTETVKRSQVPPVGLHKNAFRATNRALADQGIEFDTRDRNIGEDDVGPTHALS